MTRFEYFLIAIKQKRYTERGWLLATFGILANNYHLKNFGIEVRDKQCYIENNGNEVLLEDFELGAPIFPINERIILSANALKCLTETVTTTYGIAIVNVIIFEYPYEGKVPYINTAMNGKVVNKIASDMLKTDVCTIEMHHKFENAISFLMPFAHICITSATRKAITPNPETDKLKAALLQEHAATVNETSTISLLQDKLLALDKEYLENDPSSDFFITSKANISRLKMTGLMGAEQDFIDETKLNVIHRSLNDGWTVEDIPKLVNNSRGGSYNRGANTALGGATVKEIARVFQTYNIISGNCGTKRFLKIRLDNNNYKNFVGRYMPGEDKVITLDYLEQHIGDEIEIQSPIYCITTKAGACTTCLGDIVSNNGIKLNAQMMTCVSKFLSLFMALMHAQQLSLQRYSYKERIT